MDEAARRGRAREEDAMADGHAKPNHDYHILPLSPWPFTGSLSAFVMAIGGIAWMKHMPLLGAPIGPYVFGAGLLGVLYTMLSWWSDVIQEAKQGDHTRVVQISLRYGMILFIASEVMFFVAWFWAYFDVSLFPGFARQYLRTEFTGGHWPPKGVSTIDAFHLPLFNTLILLTSGTTITWAHHAMLLGDRASVKTALLFTVLLGLLFTGVQAHEYMDAPFAFHNNVYGSTFFMATGFHGLHVIIGTIFLAICLMRANAGQYTPRRHLGFEFAAWYWHFVDVVWLFLFVAIYVWGSWGVATTGAAS